MTIDPKDKTWDLSLYELHRTPQPVIQDNTEIAVSPRSLHSEIMCPICLAMLKHTMTTKECLHRFCSDCIITALRSGNKECPTCRKKLVSKRSLRADPNFDLLISKIYPSREEYEADQERILAKVNQSHSQQALMNSITQGIKSQQRPKQTRVKKERAPKNTANTEPESAQKTENASVRSTPSPSPSNTSSFTKVKSTISSDKGSEESDNETVESRMDVESEGDSSEYSLSEIELIFKPHPVEMNADNFLMKVLKENAVRYLKTTANATIEHLCKYLEMRLTLDLDKATSDGTKEFNFCIYVAPQADQFVVLPGSHSLSEVHEKYWNVNKPLELFYSWKKP
uniref:RING-type E3 ubiquitin transferase n=1 Tax=Culicoides sonorensis TaxID=179676 RepID=A0A336MFY5_CULSO